MVTVFTKLFSKNSNLLSGKKANLCLLLPALLLAFSATYSTVYGQCQDAPAECQQVAGQPNGPYPCAAKLYCSNNTIVTDGLVTCKPSADTDGCGIGVNVPSLPGLDSDLDMFLKSKPQIINGGCYTTGVHVQWIKYWTPAGVNQLKIQGVGQLFAWAVFRKINNTPFTSPCTTNTLAELNDPATGLAFVECSTQNQYKNVTDLNATAGVPNLYYIALFYKDVSQGSVNFKAKECNFIQSCVPSIACDDALPSAFECDDQAGIKNWFDNVVTANFCGQTGSIKNDFDPADFNCSDPLSGSTHFITFTLVNGLGDPILVDGNPVECTVDLTIKDTKAPVLSGCPDPAVIPTIECGDALPTVEVTASDACDTDVPVVYSEDKTGLTGCSGTGKLVRTWTATDDCGNPASCSQTVTIADTKAPVLSGCPDPAVIPTIECGDALPTVEVTTADACDADVQVVYSEDDTGLTGCSSTGKLVRTWTATDDCGNPASCSQTVTIADTKAPVLSGCPDPAVIPTIECGDALPTVTVTAADVCDTDVPVVYSEDKTGLTGCSNTGTLVRTWTATDDCGNPASCSQTVTIEDTTPPTPVCPPGKTDVACVGDLPCATDLAFIQGLIDQIEANSTDACGDVHAALSKTNEWGCSDKNKTGVYTFGITFSFEVSDDCGKKAYCDVTYSGTCQPLCTFTQGAWGNAGGAPGSTVGKDDYQVIQTLIQANGGVLKIGAGTRTLSIPTASSKCVVDLLPSSGGPGMLKPTCTTCTDCARGNEVKSGRLANNLATNVIALQLNIWFTKYDWDGDPSTPTWNLGEEPLKCVNIPKEVLSILPANPKVKDLLALANNYLGGVGIVSTVSFGAVTNAVTTVNEYWDNCAVKTPCSAAPAPDKTLPLIVSSPTFDAYQVAQKVNMHWVVPDNQNIARFKVEHSTDGEHFTLLAERNTKPGDDWKLYELSDEWPADGLNVYRLTIHHLDGTKEVMPDKVLYFNKPPVFSLIPNPAKDEALFNIELLRKQNVTISMYNTFGQEIFRKDIEEVTKAFERINLTGIENGFYIVSVKVGDEIYSSKLIVRK